VIHDDAPLSQQFLDVAIRQAVREIPSHRREDDGLWEMTAVSADHVAERRV